MHLFDNPQIVDSYFRFELCLGHGAHQIPLISDEAFGRAAFDRISSVGYETLKKRFLLASEVMQGYDVSDQEFAMLDDAIASGTKYNELIKAYLSPEPSVGAGASSGKLRSAINATLARTVGGYDDSEATLARALHKVSGFPDTSLLDRVTRSEWMLRFPTSAGALVSSASKWIIERLEVQSNTYAHRTSDEQFRSTDRRVENAFQSMFTSLLKNMKDEVNKAEVETYPT